ncbi:MAG: TRAP transporter substrate-binding protein DctP [Pseudomonadota bacterium]
MKRLVIATAAIALGFSGHAKSEDVLTATHVFPTSLIYTQSFLEFVDAVNERGEGVVRIDVRGGPEAIGMFEQPAAVRDGIVDMVYTPGSFYGGIVAEKDALVASNMTGPEARASGGIDFYNQIHQDKMGVYFLGWMDSGVPFNLWMTEEPTLDGEGNLDISGEKVRGNPIFNAFFTDYLGAQVLNLPSTELYTALQRGTITATGWTSIGVMDLSWDDYLKYRVDPAFFSTDLGVLVNLDSWNRLSDESKAILQEVAIEHEAASAAKLQARIAEEFAELEKRGLEVVTLEGDAAESYVTAARETTWNRMREQMEAQGTMDNYDRMIELFNK